jgi:two-component system LytT family response regulator
MYTAAILDDDIDNIDLLVEYIELYCKRLSIEKTYTDMNLAVEYLQTSPPDILFLDINFGDQMIFELLNIVKPQKSKIIFVSSYETYALQSIDYSPSGYIVKPIDQTKLISEVSKAINSIEELKVLKKKSQQKILGKIKVKGATSIDIIDMEDIIYAEADGRYTTFYLLNNRSVICTKNLGAFEEILPKTHFIRIHSKYITSINKIETIMRGKAPNCILSNGVRIPISRRRLEEVITKVIDF